MAIIETPIGQKFGLLTILKEAPPRISPKGNKSRKVLCQCDCGNKKEVELISIKRGVVRSCGCAKKQNKIQVEPGTVFGRLTVLKEAKKIGKQRKIFCQCECGNKTTKNLVQLRTGNVRSCGCLRKEVAGQNSKTHGLSNTRLFWVFHGMKARCYNENHQSYKHYGARGIYICEEWSGRNSFADFYEWSLENGYQEGLEIDRVDNNGPYAPNNCRWVTPVVNANNRRARTTGLVSKNTSLFATDKDGTQIPFVQYHKKYGTGISLSIARERYTKQGLSAHDAVTLPHRFYRRQVTYKGKRIFLYEYCEIKNLNSVLVSERINRGWTVEDAITKPLHTRPIYKTGKGLGSTEEKTKLVYKRRNKEMPNKPRYKKARKSVKPTAKHIIPDLIRIQ